MTIKKEGYDHQHALTIPNFENFDYKNMVGAFMNNLVVIEKRCGESRIYNGANILKCLSLIPKVSCINPAKTILHCCKLNNSQFKDYR